MRKVSEVEARVLSVEDLSVLCQRNVDLNPKEINAIDWEQSKAISYALNTNNPIKAICVATCHYYRAVPHQPKSLTLRKYISHWATSQGHRTDLYSKESLTQLLEDFGSPVPINGLSLGRGYSYVWERIQF